MYYLNKKQFYTKDLFGLCCCVIHQNEQLKCVLLSMGRCVCNRTVYVYAYVCLSPGRGGSKIREIESESSSTVKVNGCVGSIPTLHVGIYVSSAYHEQYSLRV